MTKALSKIRQFWNEDTSLTITLVLFSLLLFVCIPVLDTGDRARIVIKILYSLILFTCMLSVATSRWKVLLVSITGGFVFMVSWLAELIAGKYIIIANEALNMVFNLLFSVLILLKTLRQGEITVHRVQGSVLAFLIVGLAFSNAYRLVALVCGTDAFNNLAGADAKQFLYFSFTTLTTTGYGDITPVHPVGRSLANVEGLIGQLYPAILIARLVSLEIEARKNKR